ncbi:MAG: lipoyl synthase [Candidatus Omnitrophica bacterium]|nr:lipoyl synthase [Candidatus Omnitrophota bacterium]MDD5573752.1 lipoyl synthase [Candidatus Omnitrophota bacterium]
MKMERRPDWLKKKVVFSGNIRTAGILKDLNLNTVCREARCPNISECFQRGHATFLVLGKHCTRSCRFCHVPKDAPPETVDPREPGRIARAVKKLGLKHVVVTSVTRDDLPDGGARHFARTVGCLRRLSPCVSIELLVPDFRGDASAVRTVVESAPDIFGHNLETVARLYPLRPQADYHRSLDVLKEAKAYGTRLKTKSALMLGLGETEQEVMTALGDLRRADCDFLALGQYLRPDPRNVGVKEYLTPQKFETYRKKALALGFLHVESAPYVRSSYNAASYLA